MKKDYVCPACRGTVQPQAVHDRVRAGTRHVQCPALERCVETWYLSGWNGQGTVPLRWQAPGCHGGSAPGAAKVSAEIDALIASVNKRFKSKVLVYASEIPAFQRVTTGSPVAST